MQAAYHRVVGWVMDPRKMRILQAITDDYIRTGDPVGSRTIARKYGLGVSPATIRNEMADLEELGYLEQPHTSAGRIPSDKGYRFYVDELMDPQALSPEQVERLREEVLAMHQAMEHMVQRAARLLSLLTQYTAVVMAPEITDTIVKHFQLTLLDDHHVLVVLVTEPGFVKNQIIQTPRPIDAAELSRISKGLAQALVGRSVRDLSRSLFEQLRETDGAGSFHDEVIDLVVRSLSQRGEERVYLDGTLHLLEQPEFRDIERVKVLFGFLDREEELAELLTQASRRSGVQVTIGREHQREEMQDCSMVTATYSIGGDVVGTVGVIGPTRLDYAKVVSAVGVMADSLSDVLSSLGRRQ